MRLVVSFAFILLYFSCNAYENSGLFIELEQNISKDSIGWSGDHDKQARIFNGIRNRLGDNFEIELKEFVKDNIEKCYWCGLFLIEKSYTQGNIILPELAIEIFETGLEVKTEEDDFWAISTQLSLRVLTAVAHKTYGNPERAKELKQELLKFVNEHDEYGGFYPAMSEEEYKIWDEI